MSLVLGLQRNSGNPVLGFETVTSSTIAVPVAALTLTPLLPILPKLLLPPGAALTLTGGVPIIVSGPNPSIAVPVAGLTLTPQAPAVFGIELMDLFDTIPVPTANIASRTLGNNIVTAPSAALTLTGPVPGILASGTQVIAAPTAALTLTPPLPTVSNTGPQVSNVPAAALAFRPQVPTVISTQSLPPMLKLDPRFIVMSSEKKNTVKFNV